MSIAREVLLGADPSVRLTRRAHGALTAARESAVQRVHPGGTVVVREGPDTGVRWWTWAGQGANATLAATLSEIADPLQYPTDACIRLREDLTATEWQQARSRAVQQLSLPSVDPRALRGLKFSAALPERLATATLAARLADPDKAASALGEPARFLTRPP